MDGGAKAHPPSVGSPRGAPLGAPQPRRSSRPCIGPAGPLMLCGHPLAPYPLPPMPYMVPRVLRLPLPTCPSLRREALILRKLRGTLNVVHLEDVFEDEEEVHVVQVGGRVLRCSRERSVLSGVQIW